MKTRIQIADFTFVPAGHCRYLVTYTSPSTSKQWTAVVRDMPLINAVKDKESPKVRDMEMLKDFCKKHPLVSTAGKIEEVNIRRIRKLNFKNGLAGACAAQALALLIKQPEVLRYSNETESGGRVFNPHVLFDIMIDPETEKCFAVFVDDILDECSDAWMMEVID